MADPNTTVEVEDTARRRAYVSWQRMASEMYYIATKDEISRSPRYLRRTYDARFNKRANVKVYGEVDVICACERRLDGGGRSLSGEYSLRIISTQAFICR